MTKAKAIKILEKRKRDSDGNGKAEKDLCKAIEVALTLMREHVPFVYVK